MRTSIGMEAAEQPEEFQLFAIQVHVRFFASLERIEPVCVIRFANVTLGQPCVIDNTTYIDVGPSGQEYSNIILRDNCQSLQLYCDPGTMVCQASKTVGTACQTDSECELVRIVTFPIKMYQNRLRMVN
jgi:hypothetical protein